MVKATGLLVGKLETSDYKTSDYWTTRLKQ